MTPIAQILAARVAHEGPLSVSTLMQEALLHPAHGYYATRDPFGAQGDFTTAPEISQMFGEICGLALAQAWLDQGQGPMLLVEPGPGRGTLMADMLRVLARLPNCAPQVHLIEASEHLRAVQRKRLVGHDVTWHDSLETLPEGPLYMVANEFLDALPVAQFVRAGGLWRERQLGLAEGALAFGLGPAQRVPALDYLLAHTPEGGLVEQCLPAQRFAAALGARIARQGGMALLIDYGGWVSAGDTLQALRNHQSEDVLVALGEADLTTHVDFERVAAAAQAGAQSGAKTGGALACGFATQGTWLTRLGIGARAEALAAKLSGAALESHRAAHARLTAPAQMGDLFKVLALWPADASAVAGFESPDPRL